MTARMIFGKQTSNVKQISRLTFQVSSYTCILFTPLKNYSAVSTPVMF